MWVFGAVLFVPCVQAIGDSQYMKLLRCGKRLGNFMWEPFHLQQAICKSPHVSSENFDDQVQHRNKTSKLKEYLSTATKQVSRQSSELEP